MTKFWLIRHGQTDWNLSGRWQGQAEQAPGLNSTGRAQALTIPRSLPNARFSAIYSSDLLRARQTANLIAVPLGVDVTLEPRLREMNLGAWEGMLSSDIEAQYPLELERRRRSPLQIPAPNGESLFEVAERVLAAAYEIADRHAGASVLIVSHGVALAIMLCHAQGIPLDKVYEHIPENTIPHCVEWK